MTHSACAAGTHHPPHLRRASVALHSGAVTGRRSLALLKLALALRDTRRCRSSPRRCRRRRHCTRDNINMRQPHAHARAHDDTGAPSRSLFAAA